MNALFVGLALTLAAPAPKEAPKETPKLEGQWIVEKFEGPKDEPPEMVVFVFTEGKVSIREGKKEKAEDASITVDMKKTPMTIDIRPERGPKGQNVLGIVEVKGDSMKLCFSRDGKDRPTEFKGDAATGVMMITLKRVKAEK